MTDAVQPRSEEVVSVWLLSHRLRADRTCDRRRPMPRVPERSF